ncbi:Ig-like domain-containing protein, partial [Streptomyces sp. AK02-01A]|uniref:Ig-like domain-containing protein n=1 Tax=Streptomyces sp. AK02-01A TaxID=3028648 RepID=UPI0029B4CD80
GVHSLTAVYGGNASFGGSTSPVDIQTVTAASTSTVLTSAPDPSVFGQTKILTATVAAVPPGSGTPTGTVSFFDGATLLGTSTLAGGVATLSVSTLSIGVHSLTAVYSGDATFSGSTSPVDIQTVTGAGTTTTLTSAPDPSVFGQVKILTATVAPVPPAVGTPTGTVSFFDGATLLGTGTLAGGVATLTTSTLSVGVHSLIAVYSGGGSFTGSASPIDIQTVVRANTSTVLTSAPDPSVFGQTKILTATVTAVAPGSGIPTGSVSFFDGATLLGIGILSGGVASLLVSTLSVGVHNLTAVYGGNSNFNASTSPVDPQSVVRANTSTLLTSAPDPSVFGQTKILTATVTAVAPGSGTPTGTVSFFDGATLLGSGSLSGGVATLSVSTLSVGVHSLTAVYSGNVSFNASTSPIDIQTVNPGTAATNLTAAPATATIGGDGQAHIARLSATLTVRSSGAPVAGQTITFRVGTTVVGTAITNGSGVATRTNITINPLTIINAGSRYTATFAGTAGFGSSTATAALVLA